MEWDNETALAVLARIAERDEAAFAQMYSAMAGKVHGFVLNRMRDAARAEEITADTLYEVWKNPRAFRGDSRFSTFLLGIARNKMLHAWRDQAPEHEDIDDFTPVLQSAEPDGFANLAEKQRRLGVRRCMEKLPDEQRDCLHLVFYEGLSLVEVADIQRIPENTVKTRLFQARHKIKNCLRLFLQTEGVHG
jgi:RNA polymerase sigma-70 factor, ECF subfamily